MTARRVLTAAREEIGVKENPAGSNRVKYNTAYYGREAAGSSYAWCVVFLWWVFRQAGAGALFYGGKKTASCPVLLNYHKQQGQGLKGGYRPGDVIFFNFSGSGGISHVGLCESWDGQYITTIDGNTGTGNEANGGAVMRRRRAKKYIVGAYRPAYEEEIDLTEEQVRSLIREELDALLKQREEEPPAEDWQLGGIEKAKTLGVSDGTRPMALCTRVEAMIMAANAAEQGEQRL